MLRKTLSALKDSLVIRIRLSAENISTTVVTLKNAEQNILGTSLIDFVQNKNTLDNIPSVLPQSSATVANLLSWVYCSVYLWLTSQRPRTGTGKQTG